ncbi:YggT family protein [Cohnella cholangitidis]|uniref:YggT family protein n=1 Tax=Cohnella cholangitidis TaxID=2598458 RepID=A0A7G5BTT2_9BACL|nr:YggT family protein [Cohnella cholangitidis]QMV40366.1 YggT family protein [Cohnella cholangitidis]
MDQVEKYIGILGSIYSYMIIIYVLMSWLPSVRESFVGEFLGKLVEPYLKPFRRLIPPIGGMLDISPIIAYIALRYVILGLVTVLRFLFGE